MSGQVAFEEEEAKVVPVDAFKEETIKMASAQLVSSHASKFPEEKILRQRHQVRVVPVTKIVVESVEIVEVIEIVVVSVEDIEVVTVRVVSVALLGAIAVEIISLAVNSSGGVSFRFFESSEEIDIFEVVIFVNYIYIWKAT